MFLCGAPVFKPKPGRQLLQRLMRREFRVQDVQNVQAQMENCMGKSGWSYIRVPNGRWAKKIPVTPSRSFGPARSSRGPFGQPILRTYFQSGPKQLAARLPDLGMPVHTGSTSSPKVFAAAEDFDTQFDCRPSHFNCHEVVQPSQFAEFADAGDVTAPFAVENQLTDAGPRAGHRRGKPWRRRPWRRKHPSFLLQPWGYGSTKKTRVIFDRRVRVTDKAIIKCQNIALARSRLD
ncbi:hypothetical protein BDZ88DRAFT_487699 [Geranomyces variabilis]|nr:hypothetical protein BDZ88DRAFT_487699 [Geranomyces variabilis]